MLTTTFHLLRKHNACKIRYAVLRKSLRGRGDNEPITLIEILDSNGLDDALWALCAVPEEQTAERDRLARLFACQCVRQVWHLLTDERSRAVIDVAERFAVGAATQDELKAAAYSAYSAAYSVAYSASYAAARDAYSAANAAYSAYSAAYSAASAAYSAYAYAAADAARAAQEAKFREMFG